MKFFLSSSALGRKHEGQDYELCSALTVSWHLGTLRCPIVQYAAIQSVSLHDVTLPLK